MRWVAPLPANPGQTRRPPETTARIARFFLSVMPRCAGLRPRSGRAAWRDFRPLRNAIRRPRGAAELQKAVVRGDGCHDVLTIDQHMSRLHSHDTPGSVQVHRRRPRGSEVCQRGEHVAGLQQTIYPRKPGWLKRGKSYYAPRLRAAIVGTGGISRIHGWRLQDLGSTVVGVCGRDVTKARSVANDFRPADGSMFRPTTSRSAHQ